MYIDKFQEGWHKGYSDAYEKYINNMPPRFQDNSNEEYSAGYQRGYSVAAQEQQKLEDEKKYIEDRRKNPPKKTIIVNKFSIF